MAVAIKPTPWATVAQIRAARRRFPLSIPDRVHIAVIRRELGISKHRAAECLAIIRGQSEGDVVELGQQTGSETPSRPR
jgi:hypothetical protein